jgi:hypothetical protein
VIADAVRNADQQWVDSAYCMWAARAGLASMALFLIGLFILSRIK